MIEVVLESTTVTETLEIVQSLSQRLRLHEDFKYRFIQGGYDWEMSETVDHKTIFYFKKNDITIF